jgi:adenylate cyclase class 2
MPSRSSLSYSIAGSCGVPSVNGAGGASAYHERRSNKSSRSELTVPTLEVEMKFRLDDPADFRSRLDRLGPSEFVEHHQSDAYFNHPSRDFRITDEALRIRTEDERTILCWKGPRHPGPTKTRPELEVDVAEGESPRDRLAELLTRLGFQPVFTVRKRRRECTVSEGGGPPVTVSLDAVDGLGEFVELELLAEVGAVEEAKRTILSLANRLGLNHPETRSYLALLLDPGRSNAKIDR